MAYTALSAIKEGMFSSWFVRKITGSIGPSLHVVSTLRLQANEHRSSKNDFHNRTVGGERKCNIGLGGGLRSESHFNSALFFCIEMSIC